VPGAGGHSEQSNQRSRLAEFRIRFGCGSDWIFLRLPAASAVEVQKLLLTGKAPLHLLSIRFVTIILKQSF